MSSNFDNFPNINPGDKVRITWTERLYGQQEVGEAYLSSSKEKTLMVRFGNKEVSATSLRLNNDIERTEIVKPEQTISNNNRND